MGDRPLTGAQVRGNTEEIDLNLIPSTLQLPAMLEKKKKKKSNVPLFP